MGASWTTLGRYGNALSFNGSNSMVRVADSASLDLTTAMTLSAWIRPTVSQSGWRTILQRETDAYFLNASNSDGPLRPSGGGTLGGNTQYLSGPTASPINAWTHVALTYDGAALRLFVNGTQVANRATTGAIQATDNPLWIGGNIPYGEYFEGLIDEVRVYNRALTQADIQADMSTGLVAGSADTTAPSAPTGLAATAAGSNQDRPELDRLDRQRRRHRLPGRALPGHGLHQLHPGRDADGDQLQRHRPGRSTTYRYQVRAVDAAGNLSGYSVDRHGDDAGRGRHHGAVGADGAGRDGGQHHPDRPELDRLDRQRRRHRLPGRALPGSELHQLRPGRHADGDRLQRHRLRRPRPPTATRCGRSTPPATSADTPRSPRRRRRRDRHHGAVGADRAGRHGARHDPDRPELDRLDRQRRRHRLPGRALPGRGLHQLRPGRDADGDQLQRHRPVALDHLPLPGAGGRRRRQPQRVLLDRHGDDARCDRHDGAVGADGVGRDGAQHDPDRPELDRLDRQRRRHRLPGRALPGHDCTNFAQVGTPTATTFSDTGLHGQHQLPLPGAGGRRRRQPEHLLRHRQPSNARRLTPPDRRRRRAWPRRPRARNRIDLAWTASTDNVGVTGYRVERCQGTNCTNFAQVGTPTATTFSDTGLTAAHHLPLPGAGRSTPRATSAATPRSPRRRRRPRDTTAPTAPTGLTATARRHDPDRPGLDRLDRQRRRHRLPGRALPGQRAAPTSPRSARRRHQPTATPASRRRPPTATGCGRSTPPATSAPTPSIATATTPAAPDTTAPSAPDGAHRDRARRDPDRPDLDRLDRQRRRQPATGSSAARARAAPTSPRSATPTATTFSDTGLAARPPTATRCGRSTPPAT